MTTRATTVSTLLLLSFLGSCSKQVWTDAHKAPVVDPGWHHTWDEYRNYVAYGLTDKAHTAFLGHCDTAPTFGLYNGDYSDRAKIFFLTIDDKTWKLDAFQGMHGRSLPLEGKNIVEALRTAKRLIRFKVDDGWTRQFPPNSDLSQMIEQCWSLRQRDPDAMGRLAHLGDH